MPKQKVPDIEFKFFVVGEINDLYSEGNIFINEEYQRGDIWKLTQKIELIKSIDNRYSIGVLVLGFKLQVQHHLVRRTPFQVF